MNFNIPPIPGGVEQTAPPPRSAQAAKADFGASLDAAVNVSTLPASPPPSVLEDMSTAAHVAEQLRAQARELHFEVTAGGVAVQVRDLEGNVIRTIPPAKALEIAGGAPLDG
jgi:flagellar protein FlaG